jgi:predicted nucleic acid-binding protein
MILLDTNVISEALRLAPSQTVVRWLNANHANAAISSLTIFELEAGASLLEAGRRRDALENAIARASHSRACDSSSARFATARSWFNRPSRALARRIDSISAPS